MQGKPEYPEDTLRAHAHSTQTPVQTPSLPNLHLLMQLRDEAKTTKKATNGPRVILNDLIYKVSSHKHNATLLMSAANPPWRCLLFAKQSFQWCLRESECGLYPVRRCHTPTASCWHTTTEESKYWKHFITTQIKLLVISNHKCNSTLQCVTDEAAACVSRYNLVYASACKHTWWLSWDLLLKNT